MNPADMDSNVRDVMWGDGNCGDDVVAMIKDANGDAAEARGRFAFIISVH